MEALENFGRTRPFLSILASDEPIGAPTLTAFPILVRTTDAEDVITRTLNTRRQLRDNPQSLTIADCASIVLELTISLYYFDMANECANADNWVIQMYRSLAAREKKYFLSLSISYINLCVFNIKTGRLDVAIDAGADALKALRVLEETGASEGVNVPFWRAKILGLYGDALLRGGRAAEAITALEEAKIIFYEVASGPRNTLPRSGENSAFQPFEAEFETSMVENAVRALSNLAASLRHSDIGRALDAVSVLLEAMDFATHLLSDFHPSVSFRTGGLALEILLTLHTLHEKSELKDNHLEDFLRKYQVLAAKYPILYGPSLVRFFISCVGHYADLESIQVKDHDEDREPFSHPSAFQATVLSFPQSIPEDVLPEKLLALLRDDNENLIVSTYLKSFLLDFTPDPSDSWGLDFQCCIAVSRLLLTSSSTSGMSLMQSYADEVILRKDFPWLKVQTTMARIKTMALLCSTDEMHQLQLLPFFRRIIDHCRQQPQNVCLDIIEWCFGEILSHQKQYELAANAVQRSITLTQKFRLDDDYALCGSLRSLSSHLRMAGRPHDALPHAEKSVGIVERCIARELNVTYFNAPLADSLAELALVYSDSGRQEDAEETQAKCNAMRAEMAPSSIPISVPKSPAARIIEVEEEVDSKEIPLPPSPSIEPELVALPPSPLCEPLDDAEAVRECPPVHILLEACSQVNAAKLSSSGRNSCSPSPSPPLLSVANTLNSHNALPSYFQRSLSPSPEMHAGTSRSPSPTLSAKDSQRLDSSSDMSPSPASNVFHAFLLHGLTIVFGSILAWNHYFSRSNPTILVHLFLLLCSIHLGRMYLRDRQINLHISVHNHIK